MRHGARVSIARGDAPHGTDDTAPHGTDGDGWRGDGRTGPRRRATAVGLLAVLSWALLAALTASTGTVPPLLLNAMAFAVASVIGVAWIAAVQGGPGLRDALAPPPLAWAIGVGGLFGYHALYFTALRLAPPVQASLIAYLWPLLIVLMSALLPGERLRGRHVAGALVALSGAALLVTSGAGAPSAGEGAGSPPARLLGLAFEARFWPGYLAAIGCALIWSSYSVASRTMRAVPTAAVAGFCLVTALLSLALHLVLEETVWPAGLAEWLAVIGLGLGPVGGAFYAWDRGCKHGDIRLLGIAAYAAPVLSTLVLVALGIADPTLALGAACLLVALGAVIASRPERTASRAQRIASGG